MASQGLPEPEVSTMSQQEAAVGFGTSYLEEMAPPRPTASSPAAFRTTLQPPTDGPAKLVLEEGQTDADVSQLGGSLGPQLDESMDAQPTVAAELDTTGGTGSPSQNGNHSGRSEQTQTASEMLAKMQTGARSPFKTGPTLGVRSSIRLPTPSGETTGQSSQQVENSLFAKPANGKSTVEGELDDETLDKLADEHSEDEDGEADMSMVKGTMPSPRPTFARVGAAEQEDTMLLDQSESQSQSQSLAEDDPLRVRSPQPGVSQPDSDDESQETSFAFKPHGNGAMPLQSTAPGHRSSSAPGSPEGSTIEANSVGLVTLTGIADLSSSFDADVPGVNFEPTQQVSQTQLPDDEDDDAPAPSAAAAVSQTQAETQSQTQPPSQSQDDTPEQHSRLSSVPAFEMSLSVASPPPKPADQQQQQRLLRRTTASGTQEPEQEQNQDQEGDTEIIPTSVLSEQEVRASLSPSSGAGASPGPERSRRLSSSSRNSAAPPLASGLSTKTAGDVVPDSQPPTSSKSRAEAEKEDEDEEVEKEDQNASSEPKAAAEKEDAEVEDVEMETAAGKEPELERQEEVEPSAAVNDDDQMEEDAAPLGTTNDGANGDEPGSPAAATPEQAGQEDQGHSPAPSEPEDILGEDTRSQSPVARSTRGSSASSALSDLPEPGMTQATQQMYGGGGSASPPLTELASDEEEGEEEGEEEEEEEESGATLKTRSSGRPRFAEVDLPASPQSSRTSSPAKGRSPSKGRKRTKTSKARETEAELEAAKRRKAARLSNGSSTSKGSGGSSSTRKSKRQVSPPQLAETSKAGAKSKKAAAPAPARGGRRSARSASASTASPVATKKRGPSSVATASARPVKRAKKSVMWEDTATGGDDEVDELEDEDEDETVVSPKRNKGKQVVRDKKPLPKAVTALKPSSKKTASTSAAVDGDAPVARTRGTLSASLQFTRAWATWPGSNDAYPGTIDGLAESGADGVQIEFDDGAQMLLPFHRLRRPWLRRGDIVVYRGDEFTASQAQVFEQRQFRVVQVERGDKILDDKTDLEKDDVVVACGRLSVGLEDLESQADDVHRFEVAACAVPKARVDQFSDRRVTEDELLTFIPVPSAGGPSSSSVKSSSLKSLRKQLFAGFGFLISGGSEEVRTKKPRKPKFADLTKEEREERIQEYGAFPIADLTDLFAIEEGEDEGEGSLLWSQDPELRSLTTIALLVPSALTTLKYFSALATGIPCLSWAFIDDCIAANKLRDWRPYVMAGVVPGTGGPTIGAQFRILGRAEHDIEAIEEDAPSGLFAGKTMLFIEKTPPSNGGQMRKDTLRKVMLGAGCTEVRVVFVVPSRLTMSDFDFVSIDKRLSESNTNIKKLKEAPNAVTFDWVKDCLSAGILLPCSLAWK